jgi:ribosome maturation factor RimP
MEGKMKKSSGGIAAAVTKIAEPLAEELGYFLWDVEYVKEGSEMYLRITIDSEDGINIEDCEKMHRAIDPLLDEADPIDVAYHLEVSSTGIERELKNEKHINACIGWDVELKLYAPVDGVKTYTGELLGMSENGEIRLSCDPDGVQRAFPRASIASLCTVYHFENDN